MRVTIALAATFILCACDASRSSSPQEPAVVTSVCELVSRGAALDGNLVRFRSRFDVAVEYVRAFDSGCPEAMIFLHHAANAKVDFTLCSEPNFRYGCPVNPDFEVRATFTGVFHAAKDGGIIDTVAMTEVSGQSGPKAKAAGTTTFVE